jgi:hypothetical protein
LINIGRVEKWCAIEKGNGYQGADSIPDKKEYTPVNPKRYSGFQNGKDIRDPFGGEVEYGFRRYFHYMDKKNPHCKAQAKRDKIGKD